MRFPGEPCFIGRSLGGPPGRLCWSSEVLCPVEHPLQEASGQAEGVPVSGGRFSQQKPSTGSLALVLHIPAGSPHPPRVGASSRPLSCLRADSGVTSPATPPPKCTPRPAPPWPPLPCLPCLPLRDWLGAAGCGFQGLILPGSGVSAPLCILLAQGCHLSDLCLPVGQPAPDPVGQQWGARLGARVSAGWDRLPAADRPRLNTISFPEGSNTDRPDASAVHLHDFQRFLLHEQQVRGEQGGGRCACSLSPCWHLPSGSRNRLPAQWRLGAEAPE